MCSCIVIYGVVCEICGSTAISHFNVDSRYTDMIQFNAHINIAKYKELSNK